MIKDVKPTDKLVFDLEMHQIDYSEQKIEQLRVQIAEKYGVPLKNVVVDFKPINKDKDGNEVSLAADVIESMRGPQFQQTLFQPYLDIRGIKEDALLERLYTIDNTINSFIDFDAYANCGRYKLKYLKWSNYLSYGPDNYFDFTKLKGLVLLNSQPENQGGKTTFAIDLLRFGLYGQSFKVPTLDKGFNTFLKEATEYIVETGIEINGEDYVIRRTVSRPPLKKRTAKSKPKQKVEYFRLVNGDTYEEIENCEGENTAATNNIIRQTIGGIEDFNLVISANSRTLNSLLDMGQADKSRLFSRWLGLLSIEEKERVAKDYYKNKIVAKHSNYNIATLETEIKDYQNVINSNHRSIKTAQEFLNIATANIEQCNQEKMAVMAKRRTVKEELQNVDVVTLDNTLAMRQQDLEAKRGQMDEMKKRYFELKDSVFDQDAYNAKKEEVLVIERENAEFKATYTHLQQENQRTQTLIDAGTCPTCGQPIDLMSKTQSINENNDKMTSLIEKGKENKAKLAKINAEIAEMEHQRDCVNALSNLKLRMAAVKSQIDTLKLQIAEIERQKAEIEVNKENITHNAAINNKLLVIDTKLKTEQSTKEMRIAEIARLNKEIDTYNNEIKKRNDWIVVLQKEEAIRKDWAVYLDLIGKNGIIKIVLKRALPIINNEVARLLNGLCDFDVVLSISDDNKVCMDLVHDGEKLDLGTASSGFEGTMAALALRCALSNIATLSRPNCLTLDEVLGGLSAPNMENIMTLYRRALNNYDFILHICHDTSLMDYHDSIVTVTKTNNVSTITSTV